MKTPDMVVDLEALETLSPPHAIGYNPQHFSKEKPKLEFNEKNAFEILRTSDTVNHVLKANDVKQNVEAGFPGDVLKGFKFPDFVKARNREKMAISKLILS